MDQTQIAQELASKILSFIDPEATISSESEDGRLRLNAQVKEAGFLIGFEGENLKAFQHLLGLMLVKKFKEPASFFNFVFDINNYQKEKEDYLAALAKNTAHRVLETQKPEELEPMSAFERRLIHVAVEKVAGVKSESVGEGEERRVVIKPVQSY